jgi:hypothetical protein
MSFSDFAHEGGIKMRRVITAIAFTLASSNAFALCYGDCGEGYYNGYNSRYIVMVTVMVITMVMVTVIVGSNIIMHHHNLLIRM